MQVVIVVLCEIGGQASLCFALDVGLALTVLAKLPLAAGLPFRRASRRSEFSAPSAGVFPFFRTL